MNKNAIITTYMQRSAGWCSGKEYIPLSSFKLCVFVIVMLCLYSRNGYCAYIAEKGKLTFLTTETKTLNYTSNGLHNSGQGATLVGFTGVAATSENSCQSNVSSSVWSYSTSYRTVTNIDGYYGILISTGILLVPTNMAFTSTIYSGGRATTGTLTTDNYGVRTVSGGKDAMYNPSRWCSTVVSNATLDTTANNSVTSGNGSVEWAVYVSPTATAKNYSIPSLYWVRVQLFGLQSTVYSQSSISGQSLQVVEPMSCTITQPDTVAFGEINLTGNVNGQVLAYSGKKNLVVNCLNGNGNSYPATISVTGAKGRDTDTLKMTMTDAPAEPAPAEIRGFIGRGAADWPGSGICDGSKSYDGYIAFDASLNQQIALENNLQPGVNNIPYSFTLCSNAGTNTGPATATATINLTWN